MSKRIDAATRAKVVEMYLADENATYAEIGRYFGINQNTISKIIKKELQAGNGIVPDRRQNEPEKSWVVDYITPLHKHKQELELAVEHKQVELDKAKQELRDFVATLERLLKAD